MASLPPSERAEGFHSLDASESSAHRTLGVVWDPLLDQFRIEVKLPDRPFTKSGVVAVINSIFDPIGAVAPVSLGGKLIQRMVLPRKENMTPELLKCGWDTPLPKEYEKI